jgi:hypothetical protein
MRAFARSRPKPSTLDHGQAGRRHPECAIGPEPSCDFSLIEVWQQERTRLRGVTRSNGTDHFWMGQQSETGFKETNGDVLEADFGTE